MALDWYVRLPSIHARAATRALTNFIAHGVFDFESDEVETGQWTLGCRDVDADAAFRITPIGPRRRESCAIDIVFVLIPVACDPPENPAGNAAFEIDPIAAQKVADKVNASADSMNLFRFELA